MQHLDTDRLAALADESPTAEESAHLATCVACRRERAEDGKNGMAHQKLFSRTPTGSARPSWRSVDSRTSAAVR